MAANNGSGVDQGLLVLVLLAILGLTAIGVLVSYPSRIHYLTHLFSLIRIAKGSRATYERIGGWLYVGAVALFLVSLEIFMELISILPPFIPDIWAASHTPEAALYHPLLAPFLLFELIGGTTLVYVSGLMASAFFNKRRTTAKLTVGFLIGVMVFLVTGHLMEDYILASTGVNKFLLAGTPRWSTRELFVLLLCLVWTPYLLMSKRVKATFVN